MTRITRIGARIALLVTCSATFALAQDTATKWRVATGRTQQPDGTWAAPKPFTPEARQALVQEIVRELAQADITRDWQPAAKKLETWGAILTWSGVPDRESLLEHVALRKVELYERFGRTREALAAVEGVLVRADVLLSVGETTARGTWSVLDGIELVDATAEDLALQTRVLATPYITANRERLRKLIQEPADEDGVAQVVERAVRAGDRNQVLELGRRAVPALRKYVAPRNTSEWVAESNDPLSMLAAADEAAAAAVILEHFDRGGTFWRRRALRAMKNEQVLWDIGTYAHDEQTNTKPTLLEPWWQPVVLRFLQEPETAQDSLVLATALARADALDAKLVAAISGLLRSGDTQMVSGLQQLLSASLGAEGTRTILESMLDSPDASQRAFAANGLLRYRETPSLWAHARSADPVVRLAAARSFGQREVFNGIYKYDGYGAPQEARTVGYRAPLTRESLSVIETLLADADIDIREAASQALRQDGVVLSEATWLALAKDPSLQVRENASRALGQAPVSVAARVLAVLAADAEPSVLGNVLSLLRDITGNRKATIDIDLVLEPIRIVHENPQRASVKNFEGWVGNLYPRMLESEAGRALLATWALTGDAVAGSVLRDDVRGRLKKLREESATVRTPVERATVGIPYDDARLCEFLSTYAEGSQTSAEEIAAQLGNVRIVDVAPWRALATDVRKPLWLRLYAFALLVDRFGDGYVDAVTRALSPSDDSAGGKWYPALRNLFARLPVEPARAVFEGVLRARPVTVLASDVTELYVQVHTLDSASADAILAATFASSQGWRGWNGSIAALREVAKRSVAEQGDWFEKAVRTPRIGPQAVQILGELREPKYRALLVSALDPTWLSEDDGGTGLQNSAIVAIGGYLDDEAVEILLGAAERFNGSDRLRNACYDALQRIQIHREQRAAWEQRKRAGATRDAAINELVKILETAKPDLRAQVVRSLATLGAVEELPRILKLLKDQDPGVREAAQRALEVLNASTAAPR